MDKLFVIAYNRGMTEGGESAKEMMGYYGYFYRGKTRNYYYTFKDREFYYYEVFPDGYEGDEGIHITFEDLRNLENFIQRCQEEELKTGE